MSGNYEKGMYNQLMDIMSRLDAMEKIHKEDHREICSLTGEVKSLHKENIRLKEELTEVNVKNRILLEKNEKLEREVKVLRVDNERMKRSLNNDSSNSSLPPSSDGAGKPANTYNGREKTKKKPGGQPKHKGNNLSKAEVEQKIADGSFKYRIREIGDVTRPYVTRYKLDLEVRVIAEEIRIHADEDGKYYIPAELGADVSYGNTIRGITAFLYSEGVVANDRIGTFINALSGDRLHISTGSIYGFCKSFAGKCAKMCPRIEELLLNAEEICTDATTITTDAKQSYIRNFSTKDYVLYYGMDRKNLKALKEISILKQYSGTLTHDHETALYHFGRRHVECNVHIGRYLMKNTQETGNKWSENLRHFLFGMHTARKKALGEGITEFSTEQLRIYEGRYDSIIKRGFEENRRTTHRYAKKEEKALLRRLEKYRENHLLFLHDFKVHFSNNISEKDLRICKNREKMAGGFRTAEGRQMYCNILSFIETMKRQKRNLFQSIIDLIEGTPVLR